jgi:hypothetical protein
MFLYIFHSTDQTDHLTENISLIIQPNSYFTNKNWGVMVTSVFCHCMVTAEHLRCNCGNKCGPLSCIGFIQWLQNVTEESSAHNRSCGSVAFVIVFWGALRNTTQRWETVIWHRGGYYTQSRKQEEKVSTLTLLCLYNYYLCLCALVLGTFKNTQVYL